MPECCRRSSTLQRSRTFGRKLAAYSLRVRRQGHDPALQNRDERTTTATVSPRFEAAITDYEQKWWRYDICVKLERALLIGINTDRDIASSDELKTHPFYTEFLTKRALGYFIRRSAHLLQRSVRA
jgi:hypothetical protein